MGGGRGKGKGELGDAWAGLTEPSTDTCNKIPGPLAPSHAEGFVYID